MNTPQGIPKPYPATISLIKAYELSDRLQPALHIIPSCGWLLEGLNLLPEDLLAQVSWSTQITTIVVKTCYNLSVTAQGNYLSSKQKRESNWTMECTFWTHGFAFAIHTA